jgi:hypothetical protein
MSQEEKLPDFKLGKRRKTSRKTTRKRSKYADGR